MNMQQLPDLAESYARLLSNVGPSLRCADVAERFERTHPAIIREHLVDPRPLLGSLDAWASELEKAAHDVKRISQAIRVAYCREPSDIQDDDALRQKYAAQRDAWLTYWAARKAMEQAIGRADVLLTAAMADFPGAVDEARAVLAAACAAITSSVEPMAAAVRLEA